MESIEHIINGIPHTILNELLNHISVSTPKHRASDQLSNITMYAFQHLLKDDTIEPYVAYYAFYPNENNSTRQVVVYPNTIIAVLYAQYPFNLCFTSNNYKVHTSDIVIVKEETVLSTLSHEWNIPRVLLILQYVPQKPDLQTTKFPSLPSETLAHYFKDYPYNPLPSDKAKQITPIELSGSLHRTAVIEYCKMCGLSLEDSNIHHTQKTIYPLGTYTLKNNTSRTGVLLKDDNKQIELVIGNTQHKTVLDALKLYIFDGDTFTFINTGYTVINVLIIMKL